MNAITPVAARPKRKVEVSTTSTPPVKKPRAPKAAKEAPDLLDGLPKPKPKAPKRAEPEGRYSLIHRNILGLPLFDPAAHDKRGMNRTIKTTLTRKVTTESGESRYQENEVEIFCGVRLGADDLDCLLALIYLAGVDGKVINGAENIGDKMQIIDHLETLDVSSPEDKGRPASDNNVFLRSNHLTFVTTFYALRREMGLAHGGRAYALVLGRLERLSKVNYSDYGPVGSNARRFRLGGARQNLVSARYDEQGGDEIHVTLNAPLSQAVLGKSFAKVPLDQYRELETNTARILFVRLCAAIPFNSTRPHRIDNLVDMVFADPTEKASTKSQRRRMIREAVDAIDRLPTWQVEWVSKKEGRCRISRGKDPHPGRIAQQEMDFSQPE